MIQSTWIFEKDDLSISVHRSNNASVVVWRGVSDTRSPGAFLNPVAEQLVEKLRGTRVTIDFRLLEYMNSATVAPLINFVKSLDASGSLVTVLFSEIDWQRVHMNCMKSIARTLKHVKVECRAEDPPSAAAASRAK